MPLDENAENATLTAQDGSGAVTFDFNPDTIVLSHRVPMQPTSGKGPTQKAAGENPGGPMIGLGQMAEAKGIATLSLRSLMFVGTDVKTTCELFYKWTMLTPVQKQNVPQDLPKLIFRWGPLHYLVNLNQVTINYTRFARNGTPVRATVDLTLHVVPDDPTPTNPTSGGPAGRQSHVLTGAETLAGLATKTYGSPGGWRQIAAANGIQDPLRVKPGTLVYLPNEEEAGR